MDKIFKLLGFVIPIAAIAGSYFLLGQYDLRSVTTENDFVTAILHSDAAVAISNQLQFLIGTFMIASGMCFGILTFGIGLILSRLKGLGIK